MTDQGFLDEVGAGAPGQALPVAGRLDHPGHGAVASPGTFVGTLDAPVADTVGTPAVDAGPSPPSSPWPLASSGPLARRIGLALARGRGPSPVVVRSELVTALLVTVPHAPARQRAALLTFAVEERVGVPIDHVAVAPGPAPGPAAAAGAGPGAGEARMALVIGRETLDAAGRAAPDAPILPDFLGVPRPAADRGEGAPPWAVWREGERAVVRRADGTGFAVAAVALPGVWARAGRPPLLRYHEPLPPGLPATDLSAAPPPPDARDLAFGFQASTRRGAARSRRPMLMAATIAAGALLLHLALAAADAAALARVAAAERERAATALAAVLPGIEPSADPGPILARLAPAAPAPSRSGFLPLLALASQAMATSGRDASLRRLGWGADDGTLLLLVQGAALEDLQATEAAMIEAGLAVTVGAASAGEGGAEVEMRVSAGAGADR